MRAIGELKSFQAKALVSGDKSIELKVYLVANDNQVDIAELHDLLHKPLTIELKEIKDEVA
jgi:hypothetical protein